MIDILLALLFSWCSIKKLRAKIIEKMYCEIMKKNEINVNHWRKQKYWICQIVSLFQCRTSYLYWPEDCYTFILCGYTDIWTNWPGPAAETWQWELDWNPKTQWRTGYPLLFLFTTTLKYLNLSWCLNFRDWQLFGGYFKFKVVIGSIGYPNVACRRGERVLVELTMPLEEDKVNVL